LVGILPAQDFHAVCGDNSGLHDMDIPWATEEARILWAEMFPFGYPTMICAKLADAPEETF
jgi:hypothetical protein